MVEKREGAGKELEMLKERLAREKASSADTAKGTADTIHALEGKLKTQALDERALRSKIDVRNI